MTQRMRCRACVESSLFDVFFEHPRDAACREYPAEFVDKHRCIAILSFARPCLASQLMAVSAGAPDITLNGSTVAEPKTPSAALFSNPAGLTSFDRMTVDVPFALSFAKTKVEASAPLTYADTNDPRCSLQGLGSLCRQRGPGTSASPCMAMSATGSNSMPTPPRA